MSVKRFRDDTQAILMKIKKKTFNINNTETLETVQMQKLKLKNAANNPDYSNGTEKKLADSTDKKTVIKTHVIQNGGTEKKLLQHSSSDCIKAEAYEPCHKSACSESTATTSECKPSTSLKHQCFGFAHGKSKGRRLLVRMTDIKKKEKQSNHPTDNQGYLLHGFRNWYSSVRTKSFRGNITSDNTGHTRCTNYYVR